MPDAVQLPQHQKGIRIQLAFHHRDEQQTLRCRASAGKPLNDLLEFRVLTFRPYISSGCDSQVSQAIYLYAPLPELTEEELSILSAYEWDWPSFYFVKSPDQTEEHKITVRIEADYGEPVRTASIRCIPVWRH